MPSSGLESISDAVKAYARRAHADEHLEELGAVRMQEWDVGLAGGGFGEQCLAGAGRAVEQCPFRELSAQLDVLVGVSQDIYKLHDFNFRLLAACHVPI